MLRRAVAAIVCLLFLAGCGETSFLGSRYDNFTAYYNTFYNARKSFESGVQALEETERPIDQDRFLAVYPVPQRTGNRRDFDDAVRKSADVIRDHPTSRWVDDAVLLIGKSFFYQQNYPSAAQKFREAIALGTELEDEARFWLGYALAANGSLEEARDELALSLDREALDPRWRAPLSLLLGDVLVSLREWDQAVTMLRAGAEGTSDRELQARAYFLIGQLEEKRGAAESAHDAYVAVQRLRPPFELEFAARINGIRTAAQAEQLHAALDALRRLERDDKYRDRLGQIAYTRARLLLDAGDPKAAYDGLHDLLYDSDYDVSRVRGRAHYALGTLYRDEFEDFVLAAAHFDTAATALQTPQATSSSGRAEPSTVLAIHDSREQADVFSTYARVYEDVARMDSLLILGSLSEEEFRDAVLEMRRDLQRHIEEQQRQAERERGAAAFTDGFMETQQVQHEEPGAAASAPSGFLFHRDPVRVQEGRQAFVRRWGQRPLVPGWRRQESVDVFIREQSDEVVAEAAGVVQQFATDVEADLPVIDVSAVPRTPAARQEMMTRRALARYELANVLFISMNRPDSAAALYHRVIEEDADLPVAGRAYYALGELERSRGRTAEANDFYRMVLEHYPGSELDNRVREQLGMEVEISADSSAIGRARYDSLMGRWQQQHDRGVFADLIGLSLEVKEDRVPPAALMAAARIGVELLNQDRLRVWEPVPVDVPEDVMQRAGLAEASMPPEITDEPLADSLEANIGDDPAADSLEAQIGDEPPADSLGIDAAPAMEIEDGTLDLPADAGSNLRPRLLGEDAPEQPLHRVTVDQVLDLLIERHPESQLAVSGRIMRDEIMARRQAVIDSLELAQQQAADSILALSAVPDSLEADVASAIDDSVAVVDDSVSVDGDAVVVDGDDDAAIDPALEETDDAAGDVPPDVMRADPSEGAFSLRGPGGLVDEAGGWTLEVARLPDRELADALAEALREHGFRTDIREHAGDAPEFRVYVGQFAQRGQAEVARRTNGDLLPDDAAIVAVPPAGDSP